MKPALREGLFGLFFSILSIGIVLGSASLALLERQSPPASPMMENQQTGLPTAEKPEGKEIDIPQEVDIPTLAANFFEASLSPTRCAVPENWISYEIRNGDSLDLLAAAINVPAQLLKEVNCLISDTLIPGSTILLPIAIPDVTSTIAATASQMPCPLPPNWTEHILQPDENLLTLSQKYHVRIADLITANCYHNATILRTGDTIYLPYPEITTTTPNPVTIANTPTSQPVTPTVSITPAQPGSAATATPH